MQNLCTLKEFGPPLHLYVLGQWLLGMGFYGALDCENDEDDEECVWVSRGLGGRGGMEFEFGRRKMEWRWARGGVMECLREKWGS